MASTDDVSRNRAKLDRCPPGHNDRDIALSKLAEALHDRFQKEHNIDDLNVAIALHRDALELRPIGNHKRSFSLLHLAACLSDRYDHQGGLTDLEEAVTLGRAALEFRPPGHPARGISLYNLACDLRSRFEKQGDIHDLEEAIKLHRAALELRPSGHPHRSSSLHQLALCLSNRHDEQGRAADLEEAITLGRAALELRPPGRPYRAGALHNLACDLRKKFQEQADMHDLEEAIELLRAALELRPMGHPRRSSSLHQLAACLSTRYDNKGTAVDLEEAVTLGRATLELRPPGRPYRAVALHNLACDLGKKFQEQADIRDLDEAIELLRAALELRPLGHPGRSSSLHQLAACLSSRYDIQGVAADLEEAVTLGRAALQLCPPGRPCRAGALHNLACDLRKMFRKQAETRNLEEAIELLRAALELRPSGHPNRSSSLHNLAICLSDRYDNQGAVTDLEEAVTLGHAALELCPPGHPDRAVVLYNLACDLSKKSRKQADTAGVHRESSLHRAASVPCPTSMADVASLLFEFSLHLWDKFQKQSAMSNLDDAICLATYALELQLPRRSHHDVSLGTWIQRLAQGTSSDESVMLGRAVDNLSVLANYLTARFQSQRTLVDLNDAITLYRFVLQFHPMGHPGRASSLHDLAQCLADRFRQQPATANLDEAISLEQEALQLLVPGDPGYDLSRSSLTAYLQMKIDSQVAVMSPKASPVTHFDNFDVKQVIHKVAFDTLKTMPTRLLHTHTGIYATEKRRYRILWEQTELIHTVVSRYFQFVMLSHRWGEAEPLFRDIEGHPIYGMPARGGFSKLQTFCLVAFQRDYLWAWSDTCCIDKDSSAELQEAIGSMFAWYRRSALTIVYLSDIPNTSSFGDSEWFQRGWTLQELLAPRTVLFFTPKWSLYKGLTSSNHKADAAVLEELERATGIESKFLTDFSPGMDDARSRLQWASLRRTTRPEDIAYSLFGIFNVHLPVMYGESAENAFGRLLAEIISQSGDISVLDWVGEASSFHSCFPAEITSYQTPPSSPPHLDAEVHATMREQLASSSAALRTLYCSLEKSPLPRFLNRRLTLPCITHCVTEVQLKETTPSYTYSIIASGLRPLEITLPSELEHAAMSQGVLQLVRPWHSELLGASSELFSTTEEQLLFTLGRPFNALLLIELPHNEHKRIASSTRITAQPIDLASILQSEVRIFDIV
ncbi:hypothetical protein EDC04DRAFT_2891523 [Pisolithus marmoratus]|nr:hypothetical protein EDC04DRAFT_2891523 [Pisolithus marmoratus]